MRQAVASVLRKIAHQLQATAGGPGTLAGKRGDAGGGGAPPGARGAAHEVKGPVAAAAAALRRAAADTLLVLASTGAMEPSTRLEWTPLLVSWATEEGAAADLRAAAREALWELTARDSNGELGDVTAASWLAGTIR